MSSFARRRRERLRPPPPRTEDPANADRARLARQQLRVFDAQPPEVRQAFANSRYGVPVDIIGAVVQRGPNDAVKARLKERGVFPCDVGTEGVIVETISALDDAGAAELRRQAFH